jgi:hypothetical protein
MQKPKIPPRTDSWAGSYRRKASLLTFPGVPQGSIQIQINAKGYQTYGAIQDIDDEEETVEIKLNPPQQ